MTILILVAVVPAVIGLAVWFGLLFWAARADGRFDRSRRPVGRRGRRPPPG